MARQMVATTGETTVITRTARQTFKYGYFVGMSPLCASRLRQYPELRKPINEMSRDELEDAQHQWVYGAEMGNRGVMQTCWEKDCGAVRPVPAGAYSPENHNFILQTFLAWMCHEVGTECPLPPVGAK